MATSLHYIGPLHQPAENDQRSDDNYILPQTASSMSRFLRHELGMSWLHPAGILSTEQLLSLMDLQPWMRVLDVGCGLGTSSRHIAENFGCEVVGIDRDMEMIIEAGKRTPPAFRRVSYETADFLEDNFDAESFDAILMESVLWSNDKAKFLHQARRLLKPWGQLGINEATWLQTPSEQARQISRMTICESFADTLPEQAWLQLILQTGLVNIDHQINPLDPFSQRQLLREEGLFGTLSILGRIRRQPQVQNYIEELKTWVQTWPGIFGYGVYLAWKPGP